MLRGYLGFTKSTLNRTTEQRSSSLLFLVAYFYFDCSSAILSLLPCTLSYISKWGICPYPIQEFNNFFFCNSMSIIKVNIPAYICQITIFFMLFPLNLFLPPINQKRNLQLFFAYVWNANLLLGNYFDLPPWDIVANLIFSPYQLSLNISEETQRLAVELKLRE